LLLKILGLKNTRKILFKNVKKFQKSILKILVFKIHKICVKKILVLKQCAKNISVKKFKKCVLKTIGVKILVLKIEK